MKGSSAPPPCCMPLHPCCSLSYFGEARVRSPLLLPRVRPRPPPLYCRGERHCRPSKAPCHYLLSLPSAPLPELRALPPSPLLSNSGAPLPRPPHRRQSTSHRHHPPPWPAGLGPPRAEMGLLLVWPTTRSHSGLAPPLPTTPWPEAGHPDVLPYCLPIGEEGPRARIEEKAGVKWKATDSYE